MGRRYTFRYDVNNRIDRVTDSSDARFISFAYDGQGNRFTTVAKVTVADGLIAELIFDIIPWSGTEIFNTECEVVGFPHVSDSPRAVENADQESSKRHTSGS